jgi:phage shock protein A
MLKLAIREMETALQTAAESTAKAIAAEKRLRREHADSLARAESWRDRAAQFVRTKDDGNARRALTRKIEHEQLAETLSRQLDRSAETTSRLRSQLDTLRGRLVEAKRQLASLVARQRAAEARQQFAQVLGHFDANVEAFGRFEQWSERIDELETEAEARNELCGVATEETFGEAKIEAALEELKRQCAREAAVSKPQVE